jgi:hypothetical protein
MRARKSVAVRCVGILGLLVGGYVVRFDLLELAVKLSDLIAVGNHADARFASAIGDTRALISAEAAFQSVNKGYYGALECLVDCGRCVPGCTEVKLDDHFERPSWQGYWRHFNASPPSDPQAVKKDGASPSSVDSFAYVAIPMKRDGKARGVCGDSTGEICVTPTGGRPRVEAGACVIEPGRGPMPTVSGWPWSALPDEEPCYRFP